MLLYFLMFAFKIFLFFNIIIFVFHIIYLINIQYNYRYSHRTSLWWGQFCWWNGAECIFDCHWILCIQILHATQGQSILQKLLNNAIQSVPTCASNCLDITTTTTTLLPPYYYPTTTIFIYLINCYLYA